MEVGATACAALPISFLMLDPKHSPELMARVFTFLTPKQALIAGQTCKTWQAAAQDPTLWRAQADKMFSTPTPPNHPDARAAFVSRWRASRTATEGLCAPRARHNDTQAQDPATLARPHRLQLAHYILDRLKMALHARLDRCALTQGVARAVASAHDLDKPAVAALGERLQQLFTDTRERSRWKRR